jgi:hypothetical protein
MLTERNLLLDIISEVPPNSVWNISADSWDNMPNVISELRPSTRDYGWEILITPGNKYSLMEIIDKYQIYDKITHQRILFDEILIFKSYDHMTGSYISPRFPGFESLIAKYKDCDFELLELKSE